MNVSKCKFIYFDSTEIRTNGIIWGLVELGLDVSKGLTQVYIDSISNEQVLAIENEIECFDIIITQNFSVNVAEACHLKQKLYISWIYDSPQTALYSPWAMYDENYVFAFDKVQVERLRKIGLKHVFHQPLAGNIHYASGINIADNDLQKYGCDLSFIGQMYLVPYIRGVLDKLSDSSFQKYMSICNNMVCKWGPSVSIFNTFDDELLSDISQYIERPNFELLRIDDQFLSECLFLGPVLAQIERKNILGLSADNFNFSLYTRDSDFEIAKKNIGGNIFSSVYGEDVYKIYYASKLNLNITLRRIETGIPQRVFDIMTVGSPVITNYQEEIEEMFIPEKDIIVYRSSEEFLDKAKYYISHDEERQRIGINGYFRVRDEYNYSNSLIKIFEKI